MVALEGHAHDAWLVEVVASTFGAEVVSRVREAKSQMKTGSG
jgi:hypothetical protein